MWSLRGALRRDVRCLGREHHEMPIRTWQDLIGSEAETPYEDFDCVDDDRDERQLPLSRSPVYPPKDSLIKGVLGLSMSEEGLERVSLPEPLSEDDEMATFDFSDEEIASAVSVRGPRGIPGHRRQGSSDSDLGSGSDGEVEMTQAYCWKSAVLTVSREIVEEHEKRCLSRRLFATVIRDFQSLHTALATPDEIPNAVRQLCGRALTLRFPEHWYLLPQRTQEIRVLRGVDLRAYACCGAAGELIPLGPCAARSPDLHYRETPCALLFDTSGKFFLYDSESEGLFHAADNVVELASKGLAACEPVYRDGGATIPLPRPRTAVKKILAACVVGLETANAAVTAARGTAIELRERTSGSTCVLQIFDVSELRNKNPFSDLDEDSCTSMMDYVDFRLAEDWIVVGGIGDFEEDGGFGFTVSIVVLLGVTGAVYGFDLDENDVYRLADDLQTLLRRGILPEPNRFDRETLGELRLERRPPCLHERQRDSETATTTKPATRRDLKGWLRLKLRKGPEAEKCAAFAHLEEAKRQLKHPVGNIPVYVVIEESYQPRSEPEEGYGVLTEGKRRFRYPRIRPDPTDEERRRQRGLYRQLMRPPGPFGSKSEETYSGVLAERASRLAALQKSGASLRLPAISRTTTRISRRGSPMSDR